VLLKKEADRTLLHSNLTLYIKKIQTVLHNGKLVCVLLLLRTKTLYGQIIFSLWKCICITL